MGEFPSNPLALIIGEAPGGDEIKRGAPFIGKAGLELMQGLGAVGIRRSQIAISNVVLCRPPENEYEKLIHQIQKTNKKRIKDQLDPIPTPAQCCAARLRSEVLSIPRVITVGGTAYKALVGSGSIMEKRGGPVEFELGGVGIKALPTLHPSFVMRSRRWRAAFRADLGRAFRWFSSGLAWREPDVIYVPSPAQFEAFLRSIRNQVSIWDVETFPGFPDHYDPMFDRLKCIGVGTADGRACVVPFRSMEGRVYYSGADQKSIVDLWKWYFTDPSFRKAGWNNRYYDRMVVEAQLKVIPIPQVDGIIIHRVAEPEMPHNLGYSGSIHTDVHKWKADHTATKSQSDQELWTYNGIDCVVTSMAIPPLVEVARAREQAHLIPMFHKIQDICVGLHQNGIPVDQSVRLAWDSKLLKQADSKRKEIRELSGDSKFNPGSYPQVAEVLFDRLGIAPHHYTDMGDPSTDDDALRAFLSETWGLDPKRRQLITAIRDFRRVTKRRGVVVRLRPCVEETVPQDDLVDYEPLVPQEESPAEREERREMEKERAKKGKARAPGLVLPDGRVHADWNAGGTTGWRISSKSPNMQNLEDKLRDMFVAPKGFVFVGCDEAQLELRMVAGMAGCRYYTESFKSGADPHWNLCVDVFGDRFLKAPKDQQKKLRVCVKGLTYACAAKGTRVATLGPEEAKPIEELLPGIDKTWAWDGEKYAVAPISNKWSRGLRDCVRVTFEWTRIGGEVTRDSVVFTDDHQFIMRDGTDRAAGQLRPGDSLMPFGRWRSGPYRMIDQFNTGGRIGEHRAVAGVRLGDDCVVHHVDEDGCNNDPSNLAVKSSSQHSADHWDDNRKEAQRKINAAMWSPDNKETTNARLAEGRRNSAEWRSVNAENYKKMRAGLDKARAAGKGTTKGQTRSMLEAFRAQIGVLPDAEVARAAGVTREAVFYFRKTRGIPCPPKKNHTVVSVEHVGLHEVWDIEVDHPAHNFALEAGIFVHNSLYRAEDPTKLEIITSAENEDETLMFPDFTLREVGAFSSAWLRRCPEIEQWWFDLVAEHQRQGFLAEPVMGLKCDFLDGAASEGFINRITNYPAQSGGSALVHLATFRLLEQIPFQKWGPGTGLIHQGHDALVLQVPMDHARYRDGEDTKENPIKRDFGFCAPGCNCQAARIAHLMQACMDDDGSKYGMDVRFAGEARIGTTLKAV